MILAYRILTTVLYPLLLILIYCRKIFKKEDPERYKEKILISNFKIKDKGDSKLIWFHAASIGEFKSILPIIQELSIKYPNLQFLSTTTTLSSGNLAKIELQKYKNVEHRYFPLDVPFLIEKFISLWRPDRIFLVDSEIWPNLIFKAQQLKVPIALINGRLTFRSYKRWRRFKNTAKKIFGVFHLCLCSNNETANYLRKFDARNVYFKGNLKLIGEIEEKNIKNINEKFLKEKKFWFAASIHKEESLFCLKTHMELKKNLKEIVSIIAPRHIQTSKEIESLAKKFGLKVQILNKDENILEDKEIIIINYFGELQNYFKYTKSVFMGKSTIKRLKDDSGQNPIEAAKLKCKIYYGQYVYNFEEIYQFLEQNKIAARIRDYDELSQNLIKDLRIPNKEKSINSDKIHVLGQKTLIDTINILNIFLKNENI